MSASKPAVRLIASRTAAGQRPEVGIGHRVLDLGVDSKV